MAVQRVLQIAAGVLYVAVVPRALGPDLFGQLITLQALSMWFTSLGGLGAASLMSRHVPAFVERGDLAGLRKLTGSLLTIRLSVGLCAGLLYFGLVQAWLQDLDRAVIALVALTIALRTTANLPFSILLGLNQLTRWGAAELMRRLLLLPLVYAGIRLGGLVGACAALGLVEAIVLCAGGWWTRGYLERPLRLDPPFLKPYLRFSLMFSAVNLLVMLLEQGGTPLVRLITGDYVEAGYYAIAFGGYVAGTQALWMLLSGFGPLFSSILIGCDTAALRSWIGRMLRVLAFGGVIVAGFLSACADLIVVTLLGQGFSPVAALLPWLGLAGLAAGPGSLARVLSVSADQGRVSLGGAVLQLACFAAISLVLVPRIGGVGACVAVAASASLFSLYCTWQIRSGISYSMRPWASIVSLGAASSLVLWMWDGFGPLRFALFLVLFIGGAWAMGLVRVSEGRMLWHIIRYGSETATGKP